MNKKLLLGTLVWIGVAGLTLPAQTGGSVRYIYDETGQLTGTVDTSGNARTYEFDAAGNLVALEQLTARGPVDIFFIDPSHGGAAVTPQGGAPVTIYGLGFSAVPGENQVRFNGVAAPVDSATATTVRTRVPAGARSGPVQVTSPLGTATSRSNFIVSTRPVALTNAGAALTNYPILIALDTAPLIATRRMRPDLGDIRVFDSDRTTPLNYWLESTADTRLAKIWVKLPSLPAGNKTIYLQYGDPTATSASNPAGMFDFFDDFRGTTLQSGWTFWNPGGRSSYSLTERPGWLRIKTNGDADTWFFANAAPFVYWTQPSPASDFVVQTREDASNVTGNRHMLLAYIRSFNQGQENKGYFGSYTESTSVKFEADGFAGARCGVGQPIHYTRFRKTGSTVFYDASVDGTNWSNCGRYNLPSLPMYWGLGAKSWAGGGNYNADYDYFFVRKLATPEPTVSVGSEEQ